MKKNTMTTIATYIKNVPELANEYAELQAELDKSAAKAQANRDLYESAKDTVMGELSMASEAVTIGELWEAVADKLPEGFTKGKLQYAVTRLWASEIEKIEGKVNTYRKA